MMKAKIKQDLYEFRVKIGNKYVIPGGAYPRRDRGGLMGGWYNGAMWNKKDIPKIIEEIEQEYPRYKGKVKAFQVVLEEA